MPNDKTLPIPLHETWPGVPQPPCRSPWTGNQEPRHYRTIECAPTQVLTIVLPELSWGWMVLLGLWSVAQRQGVTVPNRYS